MKVIKPVTITDSLLVNSTITELDPSDPAAWISGHTYAIGDLASRTSTHRVYKRLTAGAGTTAPESDPTNWQDYGPTLRWAMFDQEVNTQSAATSSITVTIAPGIVNALALLELVGTQVEISITDGVGGTLIYDRLISLDRSAVGNWYEYFFEPFSQQTTVVLLDLPPYLDAQITMTITGTGTVKCGGFVVGTAYDLGSTQYDATAGIRDYSKKNVDDTTGVVSLAKGKFRKLLNVTLQIPAGQINTAHNVLENLRATPVVWVGDDTGELEPLTVFGFYRDFSLDVRYQSVSYYSLQIEGMT